MTKIIKNPRKVFHVLKYRILKKVGHREFKRFIVLARSRTGSNMLISFLNHHPNIYARGEIFRRLNGRDYKDILNSAFSKQPYYIKATGFKIFYGHPLDNKSCGIWNDLENMQGLYVIHLKRRNILRTLISRKLANTYGFWAKTNSGSYDTKKKKSIHFSVDELEKGFKRTRTLEDGGDRKFSNHPRMNIYYEDLVNDPEYEFRRIIDFLGLQYARPKTTLKKQNPERACDLVANYEELKAAFDGTEWRMFFED